MNQAVPCVYCGCTGYHMWAGSGGCPGAVSERERDGAAAAEIERLRAAIGAQKIALGDQGKEIERLKAQVATLLRGIDAVQLDTCTQEDWHLLNTYADELRKVAQ